MYVAPGGGGVGGAGAAGVASAGGGEGGSGDGKTKGKKSCDPPSDIQERWKDKAGKSPQRRNKKHCQLFIFFVVVFCFGLKKRFEKNDEFVVFYLFMHHACVYTYNIKEMATPRERDEVVSYRVGVKKMDAKAAETEPGLSLFGFAIFFCFVFI